jgi:hypothetical protein
MINAIMKATNIITIIPQNNRDRLFFFSPSRVACPEDEDDVMVFL